MQRRKCQNVMDYSDAVPTALDDAHCALFDDFPYVSIQEKVLKAQASGQLHDEWIRSLYCSETSNDNDVEDPEAMATELDYCDNGSDAVRAYDNFLRKRKARDAYLADYRARQERARQKSSKSEIKAETTATADQPINS